MNDLISRQAAIEVIKRAIWDKHTAKDAIDAICNVPSAQPVDKDINVPTNDIISRQAVLEYIDSMPCEVTADGHYMIRRVRLTEYIADTLPPAFKEEE